MILAADISTYLEELQAGAHFYEGDKEVNLLSYLREKGFSNIRLRLWVDPYDENGNAYKGGTNDYERSLLLATLAKEAGFALTLDFHYSDFWVDPGKQNMPKSWRGLSLNELGDKLYSYTKKTLDDFRSHGIEFEAIQIGNEITNGFLWPLGKLTDQGEGQKRGNYQNFISLLKMGIQGARESSPKSQLIIHLERSGDLKVYEEFFSELSKEKVDFDVIGMSYYPYWHGTMDNLFHNVDCLQKEFHKPIRIAEVSYAWTSKDYRSSPKGILIDDEYLKTLKDPLPYPLNPEGQEGFVRDFIKKANDHHIQAIYYWEPAFLPRPDVSWASEAGMEYLGVKGHECDEWANQTLFDFEGKALPALVDMKEVLNSLGGKKDE